MFPDVDPLYVKNLLLRNIGPEAMNNVCNLLLENTNYPRAQKAPSSTAPSEAPSIKVGLTQHVQPSSIKIKEGGDLYWLFRKWCDFVYYFQIKFN